MSIEIDDWLRLGTAIRDARTGKGFSQKELAQAAGVSRSWLARVEAGHRGAELEPLLRLLKTRGLRLNLSDPSKTGRDGAMAERNTNGDELRQVDLLLGKALAQVNQQRKDATMARGRKGPFG